MGQRKDLLGTGKLIRYEPVMLPWMLAYAEWLITSIRPPSMTERRVKLAELSKRPCARVHVEGLEDRRDFQRYVADLQRGPLEEARAKFMARMPKFADAYEKSIDGLVEQKAWKEVATAVVPALDRFFPKKADTGNAVQVNVTLSPERLAGFADDYVAAEVEALPSPSSVPDATGTP